MSKGVLDFREDPPDYEIFIQQQGGGSVYQVLIIILPTGLQSGSYNIDTDGPVHVSYFESSDQVTRIFTDHEKGVINLSVIDNTLTGTFDLTVVNKSEASELISITGKIWDIPIQYEGGYIEPVSDQTSIPSNGSILSSLAGLGLICFVGLLVLANFIFQFYIGSKVYAGQGSTWLRSLRGTATYIRGWKLPEARQTMIIWSIILGLLLLVALAIIFLV